MSMAWYALTHGILTGFAMTAPAAHQLIRWGVNYPGRLPFDKR